MRRANEATRRHLERRREEEESRRRNSARREEEHKAAAAFFRDPPPSNPPEKQELPSRKRKSAYEDVASPQTFPVKRRTATPTCRMLLNQPGDQSRESFVDIALRDGETKAVAPTPDLAASALRDGLTIVARNGVFDTSEGACAWLTCRPWRKMASQIVCREDARTLKVDIVSDGGLGVRKVGSGTFNVVFEPVAEVIPEWLQGKELAYRMTRTDVDDRGSDRYQSSDLASREAENAMFASANKIGVAVHAISMYRAAQQGHSLKFGTVFALQKADDDLYRALEKCQSFEGGASIAVLVVDLLFRASRCGVAFFDVKPANILRFGSSCGAGGFFRLTDYDQNFFLRLPEQDWRLLLLINVALLAAHVRNHNTVASRGFVESVRPLLLQLVSRRHEFHGSSWLLDVRSVRVEYRVPENNGAFELQRLFAVMATNYFYRPDLKVASVEYKWETHNQQTLDQYWKFSKNRRSWPPQWRSDFKPLILQIVDFALS